jgi:hypothetical protein
MRKGSRFNGLKHQAVRNFGGLMKSKILIIAVFGLMITGCTRKKSDTSTLSFSLPPRVSSVHSSNQQAKVSASADDPYLMHVIINITGSDIAPRYRAWDRHDGGVAPSAFTFDAIPYGSSRLIQVLAVYQSPITDSMTFFYGDASVALGQPEQNVEIPVLSLGGATSTVTGQISGRYFTSASGGPTADVAIKYNPGSGRQKMLIEKSTIFNGWFSFFALNTVAFEYELQPGPSQAATELMFGGAVNLASGVFSPAENSGAEQNRRIRAALPVHLRNNSWSGTPELVREEAQIFVWGFWGNAIARGSANWSTRTVCRSSLTGSLSRMMRYSPTVANWPAQPGLSLTVNGTVATAMPTPAQLMDATATAMGNMVFSGGSGNCSSGSQPTNTKYSNWLSVSPTMVDGRGNDNAAGFRAPFRVDSSLNWATVTVADPRVIVGDVLPGVELTIDEFRLFKKVGVNSNYHFDQADCTQLSTLTPDYIPAGSGTADGSGHLIITSNISASEATTGTAALICFYKNGKPYSNGAFLNSQQIAASFGGGLSLATHIGLEVPTYLNSTQYLSSACIPVQVNGLDASNNPGNFPNGTALSFSTSDATNLKFYPDHYCGTPITTVSNISGTSQTFFIMSSVNNSSSTITVAATAGVTGSVTKTVGFNAAPGAPAPKMIIKAPTSIVAYACYSALYEVWHDDDSNPPILLNDSVSATLPPTDFQFFSTAGGSGSCSGGVVSTTSLGASFGPQFMTDFMYTGTNTTVSIQPTANWSNTVVGGNSISATIPGSISTLEVSSFPVQEGQCTPVNVSFTDSSGNLSPTPGTVNVSVATDSGSLYSDFYCTTPTSTVEVEAMDTNEMVYFRQDSPTPTTATITATWSSLTGTGAATISPAQATFLIFVLPGETRVGTNVSGTPNVQIAGVPFNVDIYAVNYDGNLDSNYSGSQMLSFNSLNMSSYPDFESVSFTGGHVSIQVTPDTSGSAYIGGSAVGSLGPPISGSSSNVNVSP